MSEKWERRHYEIARESQWHLDIDEKFDELNKKIDVLNGIVDNIQYTVDCLEQDVGHLTDIYNELSGRRIEEPEPKPLEIQND